MNKFYEYRNKIKAILTDNGITDISEVDYILCEVLKCDRARLFLMEDISDNDKEIIQQIIDKRITGKPLQRIFNKAYFYDLIFELNENTLVPRQETELLVKKALDIISNKEYNILDLCTGSGCIAISIAKTSNAKVYASDINNNALKQAKINAKNNNVEVDFIQSNMFDNIDKKFDVIVSNPPYINTKFINQLDIEVKQNDPILALDGGVDGLDFYKIIANEAYKHIKSGGYLIMEIGKSQENDITNLLNEHYQDFEYIKDFQNIVRVICAKRKEEND